MQSRNFFETRAAQGPPDGPKKVKSRIPTSRLLEIYVSATAVPNERKLLRLRLLDSKISK